jgi:hypothetical protein
MDEQQSFAPGETVYLLAEVGVDGRIHEIGSRATVRAVAATGLTLELGGSSSTVVCAPAQVERVAEHRRGARSRTRVARGLRPVSS